MNVFREHKPGFIDCDPEPPFEFETFEELLEQSQVKRFATSKRVSHFENSTEPKPHESHLMAIYQDGSYLVVGYLKYPIEGLAEFNIDNQKRPD